MMINIGLDDALEMSAFYVLGQSVLTVVAHMSRIRKDKNNNEVLTTVGERGDSLLKKRNILFVIFAIMIPEKSIY